MKRGLIVSMAIAAVAVLVLLLVAARRRPLPVEPDAAPPPAPPPPTGGDLPDVLVDPRIVVEKRARRLAILSADSVAKTYRVVLGSAPRGDKEREGDGRTPEGAYYVCTKNPESRHRRSLGISYPSGKDAERGLNEGLITKRQYRSILEAERHYERPPWNTRLGGEIMIHGGGTAEDWTEGCIAVTDDEAQEIYDAIPLGTPIDILP